MRAPRTTWRQQLELNPELRDMSRWPRVPIDHLTAEAQKLYARRQEAVGMAVGGKPVESAATSVGRSQNEIYRLLDRSLGSDSGDVPLLNVGLLPEKRINPYTRTAEIGPGTTGFSGAFGALMTRVPAVFADLEKHLRNELAHHRGTPILGPQELHRVFKANLRSAGLTDADYPLCTKGAARTTFGEWRQKAILAILAETNPSVRARYDINWSDLTEVMDIFQFDEHHQDLNLSLSLDTGNDTVAVRLARIWVVVLVEKESEAVFGMAWGFSAQPRHDDFLACAADAITVWKPYDNLPTGLEYPAGGGHPSILPAYQHVTPCIVQLDNAWSHVANDIKVYLFREWQCIINWGRPAFPIARRVVEMVFARLAVYEHQFPSTTGNNPFDRRRDPHSDEAPRVPVQHIAAIFDVVRATLNCEPRGHLLNRSPLQVLADRARNGAILRRLLPEHRDAARPHRIRRQVVIRGEPRDVHSLHVNFAYATYKSDHLRHLLALGAKKLNVEFDRRDIRKLDVVADDGKVVGPLQVQGIWKRFPHDIRLRNVICQQSRDARRDQPAALAEYFSALTKRLDRPSDALRFLDVIRRITGPDGNFGGDTPPDAPIDGCAGQPSVAPAGDGSAVIDIPDSDVALLWSPSVLLATVEDT